MHLHKVFQQLKCDLLQILMLLLHPLFLYDITRFHLVNCGTPISPGHGFFEAYENTTEGAEIFFRCNLGLVPGGKMRAVCGADGRWIPNPLHFRCTG